MGTLDAGNVDCTLDTSKPVSVAHKDAVRVGSTANVTISCPVTIDGVSLAVDDRILLKNQCTGADNGIYEVDILSVQATGTVTLDTGCAGSITCVKVNCVTITTCAVCFCTDLCTTATNLATEINCTASCPNYTASATCATVTITSATRGATPNCFTVVSTVVTITSTDVNLSGGLNGVWTRAPDFNEDNEVVAGTVVLVEEGTANADTAWQLTTDNDIIVGTTAQTWAAFAPSSVSSILADGNILVGNACCVATSVNPSGDIDVTNTGVFSISAGVILNADVNTCAAIAYSKLATLASTQLLVGDACGVATVRCITGDISINNTGVVAIGTGVILCTDISACASINFSKLNALTSAQILVGSCACVVTARAVSGDISISNTGVVAISCGVILNADVNACAAIATSKLQTITTARLLGRATACTGVIEQLTLNSTLSFCGTALQRAALTGDITASAGSNTTSFGVGVIVNADVSACAAIALCKLATLTAGSVVFSDGCTLTQDNCNLFWCNTCNFLGIGTKTPLHTLDICGDAELVHTAGANDEHALEVDVIAGGFGDIKAIDIDYITGAIAAGEDEGVILVNIDESIATGGEVFALEILTTTEGTDAIIGLKAGIGIEPINQLVGTFGDVDLILNKTCDVTLALDCGGAGNITMFACDCDTVTLKHATTFNEVEIIVCTGASGGGVAPVFEFSTGACTWTAFSPTDGTNGFRNTGELLWDTPDLVCWVQVSCQYLIRITRTRNTVTVDPIVDKIQLSAGKIYGWDKCAAISATSLETTKCACDTLLLRAYDVNGAAYTTFGTLTAGNCPTFDLATGVTLACSAIASSDNCIVFTNKSYDLGGTGNTLTGSVTEFNTALQCETFGFIGVANAWGTSNQDITATGKWQEGGTAISPIGLQEIWIPAGAMSSVTTNGAAFAELELVTNDIMLVSMNFITGTSQKAQFWWTPPLNWDAGTVKFKLYWTETGGGACETVDFDLAGTAYANSDAIDAAVGTAQNVTDTNFNVDNDMQITAFSAAITIAGTPTAGEPVLLQLSRDVASDTLAVDAKVIGIMLEFTTDAATSA